MRYGNRRLWWDGGDTLMLRKKKGKVVKPLGYIFPHLSLPWCFASGQTPGKSPQNYRPSLQVAEKNVCLRYQHRNHPPICFLFGSQNRRKKNAIVCGHLGCRNSGCYCIFHHFIIGINNTVYSTLIHNKCENYIIATIKST